METGGPSAIEIILWVLAANAILILAGYGLVMLLKRKSREVVAQMGEQIQAHDTRLTTIDEFLLSYGGIQQEPFFTPLDELQKAAGDVRSRLNRFLAACQQFEAETQTAGNNQLQAIINGPFTWFRRWRYSKELIGESKAIQEQLAEAETIIQRIAELPWELSTQIRQLDKDVDELLQSARDLQSKGVRGRALAVVISQLPEIERAMNGIPDAFLEAEHNDLLATANSDSTIRVFETYHRTYPVVAQHLPQVRDWQVYYQKSTADYSEMKLTGANLRQSLAHPPEGLVITPIQARLDHVAQIAADINQRLSQPEVEDLKPLSREVAQIRKVLIDTEQQFARAGRQLNELRQGIEEQTAALESVSAQFNTLEHTERHPLVWDESGSVLNELRQRLQGLGQAQKPRTPEQITQQLKDVEAIRAGQRRLAEKTPRVAEGHRALLALFESAELHDGAAWLKKTREIAAQTGVYDPRNWPKGDSVSTLSAELEALSRAHESLVPAAQNAPVKETELEQRLQATQQLTVQHKALRPRADSVRTRLEKIRALEEEGKQKLTEAWTALERVALLDENNELLAEIAAAEIERLGEEIRVLGNELNQQGQGEVEKKLQKINTLSDKVMRTLNGWLAQLNAAIAEQGKQVQERLVQVENAVTLDDSAVQEARNLLAREDFTNTVLSGAPERGKGVARLGAAALGAVTHRTAADPSQTTLEATAEIKRKNDLWLTLLMVRTALEEKSEAVLAAYQEVVQARTTAQECLTELGQRVPEGKRAWPPNNQTPLTENQLLQPIDTRWETMRKQRGRADWAIPEMKRLVQQYQLAADRVRQVASRAEEDQERIQELEWQVENLKEKWQAQAQADPTNPMIQEGVQQLMTQTESQRSFIKTQYMRGVLSYEQVIHNLQLLIDEVFSARVPLDERTDIGLNEGPRAVERANGRQARMN